MDLYLGIVTHPLLWVFIALTVAVFLIQWAATLKVGTNHNPARWLRGNYVAVILTLVGGLAIGALAVYLLEIGISLAALVDRLRHASADPATNARDIRNLAYAVAVLIGVLAASATIFFSVIKVWINERTATATEVGLITDRINKAVEALGAEKTVSQVWRNVSYKFDGESHSLFETRDEPAALPDGASGIKRGDWQVSNRTTPNLEMRIGAIYALERIAQDSDRDHVQIMEILCAYIRENAPARIARGYPKEWFTDPETGKPRKDHQPPAMIYEWANALPPPRTDIQTALTVIARRSARQIALEERMVIGKRERYRLDLRNTCLQKADLSKARLNHADLSGARMQGADLRKARMQGSTLWEARMQAADLDQARIRGAWFGAARMQAATLVEARMQGTYLRAARMQGALLFGARLQGATLGEVRMQGAHFGHARMQDTDLSWARMQSADFDFARMQGASLVGAQMDSNTNFLGAILRVAALSSVDLTEVILTSDQLAMVFGDATVEPPAGVTLPHSFAQTYEDGEFFEAWRAWQKEIGFDPEDPATWDG